MADFETKTDDDDPRRTERTTVFKKKNQQFHVNINFSLFFFVFFFNLAHVPRTTLWQTRTSDASLDHKQPVAHNNERTWNRVTRTNNNNNNKSRDFQL